MGDDNENRLMRIEEKLDNLIEQLHKLESTDIRQEMRIERVETRVEGHSQTLERYFERLETIEKKPGKTALQMWSMIGSIALSVIVTAMVTFFLVYLGVNK